MPERCDMELCPHWAGDGDVCPCAVFGLHPGDEFADAGASPTSHGGLQGGTPDSDSLSDARAWIVPGPGRLPMSSEETTVPPGPYAQGQRSPIVWVLLCSVCAGFAPMTAEDYRGFLSGQCAGCGTHVRELHRFRAWIDSATGCQCLGSHDRVVGDVDVDEATLAGRVVVDLPEPDRPAAKFQPALWRTFGGDVWAYVSQGKPLVGMAGSTPWDPELLRARAVVLLAAADAAERLSVPGSSGEAQHG